MWDAELRARPSTYAHEATLWPQHCPKPSADSCCTVTLSLSDEDFGKLVSGKANAQRLFMSGKLKVKGDVMKATKLEGVLAKARPAIAKL
jgi:putative sterol carrier protein